MDTLILSLHPELSEHDDVLGMAGPVGDPVLLGQRGGGVHDQLVCLGVIGGGGLHLHGVVAIPELCQAEAANVIEIVNALNKLFECNENNLELTFQESFVMPLCSEFEDSSSEQIKLDSHLGAHGGVNDSKLVSGKNLEWIVDKVKNRNESRVTNGLQPLQGQLPLLVKGEIIPGLVQILSKKLPELVSHLDVVMVKQIF